MSDLLPRVQLSALYSAKREAGLIDVKFIVGSIDEASFDDIAQEVLRLEEAIDHKAFKVRRFNDKHEWLAQMDNDVTTDAVDSLNASVGIDFTAPEWTRPSQTSRKEQTMSDLTTNTSAFGLCSDEWQAEMLDYALSGGLYQRYWQGRWEDVLLGRRHNLHKDRAYRAKPKPVVTVEVTTAFIKVIGECVGLDIEGKQDSQIGKMTTTFHDGKPVKAAWVAR